MGQERKRIRKNYQEELDALFAKMRVRESNEEVKDNNISVSPPLWTPPSPRTMKPGFLSTSFEVPSDVSVYPPMADDEPEPIPEPQSQPKPQPKPQPEPQSQTQHTQPESQPQPQHTQPESPPEIHLEQPEPHPEELADMATRMTEATGGVKHGVETPKEVEKEEEEIQEEEKEEKPK